MNIDRDKLKLIEKSKTTKKAFSESLVLSSFLKTIYKLIEVGSKMSLVEMARFINSLNHWIKGRGTKKKSRKCPEGTIVEIEFGLSYKTETPYRHSALTIKEYTNKILVIPSTSKKEYWDNGFHPISNMDGDKNYIRVGNTDGFDHDCVLVLNDFKIVSKNRILSTCGSMDTVSEDCLYKQIKLMILKNVFKDEIDVYENEITTLNNKIDAQQETIQEKKDIIKSLYAAIRRKNDYINILKSKK